MKIKKDQKKEQSAFTKRHGSLEAFHCTIVLLCLFDGWKDRGDIIEFVETILIFFNFLFSLIFLLEPFFGGFMHTEFRRYSPDWESIVGHFS